MRVRGSRVPRVRRSRWALAATLLATLLLPLSPAARADKPCRTELGCGADLGEALDLETRMADHLWYGLALPVDYRTPERVPGDLASIGGGAWGDAGLWSGSYLGAEAFRYAVARDHAQHGPDRAFWQEQQRQAGDRVDRLLAQVDVRTRIAEAWQPAFAPSAGPDGVSAPGVVKGRAGMLMFSCAPADAPAARDMPRNSDVRGPWHWKAPADRPARLTLPEDDYVCEASTTRDAYAGTLFGLLTAFDLVGPDDAAVRDLIRDDVLAIADFLLENGWNYVHPHGEVHTDDVYDNVVTPIMVISPSYRLAVSQAARHVATVAGPADEAAKWDAVWTEELATQDPSDAIANEVNDPTPTAGYFGWNLAHLIGFNLLRLADDPATKALLRQDFSAVDRQTADDVNAFFEAVTFSMTGEPARRDAAVAHLRQWRDYRARTDLGGRTDNSSRCGQDLACVPEDQYDVVTATPAGEQRATVPGSSTRLRAVQPLPVADRAPTDFLWQRSPFTSLDGSTTAEHEEPGIDYLLPYWLLRWATEVAHPALDPLPTWPGPAYSGT